MSYEVALNKAWEELAKLNVTNNLSIKFLNDEYDLDLAGRRVLSLSCNVAAKETLSIIILHYFIRKMHGLPRLSGQWLTFREFSGVEGYYDAYRKRSIEPLIRKYGKNPGDIFSVLNRLPSERATGGDAAVVLEVFAGVPVLVKLWKADEEFNADANIYFDSSIKEIFCIEDIVVLAGIIAAAL